jgi:putative hydrolase of the HAD superfamily
VDKLRRVGLAERIEVLVGVDALGVGKPDSRVFRLVCGRLGVDPASTLYVGDELDVDARAARRAGPAGVWLDRRGTRGPLAELDVPVVTSLAELAELADRLGA